jgi:ATP-dependent RNA helicase DeaD
VSFPTATPPLARALAERNYDEPTPVQLAVLGDEANDRDLLVSAQTGSGKTVAFGLAIARNLLGDSERFAPAAAPLALIVTPTRELALQVHRELAWLYQYTGARVVSCVGGMDPRREQRELADGAHIVVGTPGRLCDHLRRGRLDVSGLKAVVLDEADEMLDMGFREDLEFILKTTPETRSTLLFSATLPREIVALARQFQKDAFRIEVAGGEGGHVDIEYRALRVGSHEVERAIVNVLRYFEAPGAIVFCNTRNAVRHLQTALLERGFSVVALSGELTQSERTLAMQALRDGRARVCVATDVAARGIDLPNLGLVIHADLPHDPEVMQHRSGRTGRAGRKGVSILLVSPARRRRAEVMLDRANIEASWGAPPQAEEIRRLDQQRMLQDPVFTEESTEEDLSLARALIAERSPEEIAAALARIYRSRLPAPEDISDAGQREGRPRDARPERKGLEKKENRGNRERSPEPRAERPRPARREGLSGGSVWFRTNVGRKKNAEARWLLPMICRRGGIEKHDIGAIRIYETSSEFEISGDAAEQFALFINRPDKEEHIRIEPLPDGPRAPEASERAVVAPAGESTERSGKARWKDRPPYNGGPKPHGKPPGGGSHQGDRKPTHAGQHRRDDGAPGAEPEFRKKKKNKKNRKGD